jgi:hypothetical protein
MPSFLLIVLDLEENSNKNNEEKQAGNYSGPEAGKVGNYNDPLKLKNGEL